MFHYKAFSGDAHDIEWLETAANAWLEETRPLIHTMRQTQSETTVVVSFLYEINEEQSHVEVATAEASVSAEQPAPADALMMTLLPQMELPY
jgi:hypothetical protein